MGRSAFLFFDFFFRSSEEKVLYLAYLMEANELREHFLNGFVHFGVEVFGVRKPLFARRNKVGQGLCAIYREELINRLGKLFPLLGRHIAYPLVDGPVKPAAIGCNIFQMDKGIA